jgi:hypothetical protein
MQLVCGALRSRTRDIIRDVTRGRPPVLRSGTFDSLMAFAEPVFR